MRNHLSDWRHNAHDTRLKTDASLYDDLFSAGAYPRRAIPQAVFHGMRVTHFPDLTSDRRCTNQSHRSSVGGSSREGDSNPRQASYSPSQPNHGGRHRSPPRRQTDKLSAISLSVVDWLHFVTELISCLPGSSCESNLIIQRTDSVSLLFLIDPEVNVDGQVHPI